MTIKNILSKILGLDRKEKKEPVELTTTQAPTVAPPTSGPPKSPSPSIPPPPPIPPSTNPITQPPAAPKPLRLVSPPKSTSAKKPIPTSPPQSIHQLNNPLIQPAAPPPSVPSALSVFDADNGPARRLTGKIAKLPREIQRIVNEMLDDAETYKSIVARLNDLGYPGFFEQNIQRWKDHGYQRWLQFHEKLEIAKQEMEEAQELAKDPQNGVNLAEANLLRLQLNTARRWDDVSEWDTETTIKNGKFYNQLSRSTLQQSAEQTRRERFRLEAELKRRKQEISEDAKQKIRDLTNPLTQAERKAILDAIDDILGIRIDPDEPPPGGAGPLPFPGGQGPGDGGFSVPIVINTVENPTTSKAETSKNTVENNQPPTDEQPEAPVTILSPGGESQSEGGLPIPSSDLTPVPSSNVSVVESSHPSILPSSDPEKESNTVENSTDSKAEYEKNTVENISPEPGSSNPPILSSSPSDPILCPPPRDKIYRDPFPISPFATTPPSRKQPRNHIPVLDVWGQLIQWIPRDQDPKFEDPVGFENRRGHSTCWMNPKNPYALLGGEPPLHRNVPIVSWEGQILEWVPAEFEPFENAQPIRSRRFLHYKIGWWEQGPDQISHYDSRVGAMVA